MVGKFGGVPDETPAGKKHWRYHCLQAKHTKRFENNRKITANDLLDPNPVGPRNTFFRIDSKMRLIDRRN